MAKFVLDLQHAATAPESLDDLAWEEVEQAGAPAPESWVFEAIRLQRPAPSSLLPLRVIVGIASENPGYVIEERAFWPHDAVRLRRMQARSEAEAVVTAGRLAHTWLCQGYAVLSQGSEPIAS